MAKLLTLRFTVIKCPANKTFAVDVEYTHRSRQCYYTRHFETREKAEHYRNHMIEKFNSQLSRTFNDEYTKSVALRKMQRE